MKDESGGRQLFRRRRPYRFRLLWWGAGWTLLLLFPLSGLPGVWQALSPLSRPAAGVICDPGPGICADSHGLSEAVTARQLGDVAGRALHRYRLWGGNMQVWQFRNGVTCDAAVRICWRNPGRRTVETEVTQWLFRQRAPDS
ncbi:YcgJ family protein [Raoultella ornithinolytica]|uniref:YcgJ family protein n=1 Tax=Raoultella ornithinolytica TaxID=54291 RepID=UPI0021AF653C|nr:YcgJ family protein [Raoultella ornithinolytica]MCT4737227.1 YcgJ family protein [Raoultella ornithinolytica]